MTSSRARGGAWPAPVDRPWKCVTSDLAGVHSTRLNREWRAGAYRAGAHRYTDTWRRMMDSARGGGNRRSSMAPEEVGYWDDNNGIQ